MNPNKIHPPSCTSIIRTYNVLLGAQKSGNTRYSSENTEDFLAGLRFEQRGRLEELPFDFYFAKLYNL